MEVAEGREPLDSRKILSASIDFLTSRWFWDAVVEEELSSCKFHPP